MPRSIRAKTQSYRQHVAHADGSVHRVGQIEQEDRDAECNHPRQAIVSLTRIAIPKRVFNHIATLLLGQTDQTAQIKPQAETAYDQQDDQQKSERVAREIRLSEESA